MSDVTQGIPLEATDFYAELTFNNDRDWWLANKPRYDALVRGPLQALADALAGEFGSAKLYRPNRDLRFSNDKRPYKDHQGLFIEHAPGVGWYLQVNAEGMLTAGGWYRGAPEQVARYRAAVDTDLWGDQLVALLSDVDGDLGGETLKTAPRGFAKDHPRIDLLRRKGLSIGRRHGVPDWMATPEVVDHVRADFRAYRPLVEWLTEHVA